MRILPWAIILIIILSFAFSSSTPSGAGQSAFQARIGIDQGHGNLHVNSTDLLNFTRLMNTSRAQIVYSLGALNSTFLSSINLLIVSSPQSNFTGTELLTVSTWYSAGGRLLLSASSENGLSIDFLNTLLRYLNSKVAFDRAYLQDPLFNLNATTSDSDRLILPIINHEQGLASGLTLNVRRLYAFRPIPIITYEAGIYGKYSPTSSLATNWLVKTAGSAKTANITGSTPLVYPPGTFAEYPVAIVEHSAVGKLALLGFPIFSSEMELFAYLSQHPYDNLVLFRNLCGWLSALQISGELEGAVPLVRASNQPIVLLYTGSRSLHVGLTEREPLFALLTNMGFNVQTVDSLQNGQLKNATALIIQTPFDLIASNDTTALKTWLQESNKLLVLSSMADYSLATSATQSLSLNDVMKDLGATLRFEESSMIDYETNLGGSPNLALASNINQAKGVLSLTKNVRSLFLQFGTILAGWNGTGFVPLENQTYLATQTNITWIARSSNNSVVFDLDPTYALQAHTQGQRGSYITAALERYMGSDRIVLLGGPIFTNFSLLLNYPTLYGYPVDNLVFIRNLFTTTITQSETMTSLDASATPTEIPEGQAVTLHVQYNRLQSSLTNLSEIERTPITPSNVTISLGGSTLSQQRLPNETYIATSTPTTTGSITWSVSGKASNFQPQSTTGTVKVDPLPTRFTLYVLAIPVVIFIAVTIVITARKTK